MTPKEIILKCKDEQQLGQHYLYKRYYSTVAKSCLPYSKSEHEYTELVQECFIKIFDNIHTFIGYDEVQLGAWIKKVSKHKCIDEYRKKKALKKRNEVYCELIYDKFDTIDPDTEEPEEPRYDSQRVEDAISQLSHKYRRIFEMYVIDGLSHQEISEYLNINIGTSKSNLHKAKHKLQKILKDER
jgi:RNA polymerase sigma-70 factor (ECF subfamily)